MDALLAQFGGAYPDDDLVVQAGDLAYPVVRDVAGNAAWRLGRIIAVAMARDRGTAWRLLVNGEEVTGGTVQPYEDETQPE
jgi:hypothetical protein